ncbi:iron/sulfur-binding oxidoreductase [Neisseria gonorrhoeae]|uniref:Iron/sulfur-binding oxidoreductase n=1 Tax=Neisseria gonorrhoeae TaxID=485 RepID=A0A378VXF6_NEIGO|nr:iron/sulfur-binding oxidoreductase [Neisseria gonorrhoeae]
MPSENTCFTPVLSRPGEGWQGRKGHVQDIAAQDHPDLSEYEVFACGSPAMTEQAKICLCNSISCRKTCFSPTHSRRPHHNSSV